ncbi:MAG: hypothetical protein IBX50_19080, partial [Marinospirillum sp.]|uniref:hypothetical protein n=1 Tax=Marinospirillum sp. TaxID=2183934 RepID=UPI0019E3CED8
MKHPAIISTLLDRQAVAVDKFIKTTKFNIITPRLFSDTHQSIAKRNQVECHVIENEIYNNTIKVDCKKEEARIISLMSESKEDLKLWLKEKSYPDAFSDSIINHVINRTPKLVRMFLALESLKSKHDIKALFINQEYMVHEASLLQWCKANNIPVVHICHSPYPARSVASVRHFISDHVSLASERCTETLDDIGSKECTRHITGMVNWDTYRNIDFTTLETLRKNLSISDDALIISFFTTYPAKDCSTGDSEVYHKTLNAFLSAASTLINTTEKPIHFIVKDRPSGTSFTKEEISSKAKKLGLDNHLSYVFDRPESIIVLSDITISSGSSIAFESMSMGKATVDLVPRQNFLSSLCFGADDGVIQVNVKGLVPALKRLIEDEDYREEVAEKGFNNQRYVYPTQELRATQDTTALLLDICGFK